MLAEASFLEVIFAEQRQCRLVEDVLQVLELLQDVSIGFQADSQHTVNAN